MSPSQNVPTQLNKFFLWGRFAHCLSLYLWLGLTLLLVPPSIYLRFYFLSNPLLEPHPIRQAQTALTIYYFARDKINLFAYHAPDKRVWNQVYEFPLYQLICSFVVKAGISIEIASRLVTLFFFFAGAFLFIILIDRFLNRQVALWAGLFYLVSPFNVIFSRTCLIDFTALFFVLAMVGFTMEYIENNRRNVPVLLAIVLSGTLAALIKAPPWLTPTILLCIYVFIRYLEKHISSKQFLLLALLFIIQAAAAYLWMKWASHVRADPDPLPQIHWHFGFLPMRFELSHWLTLSNHIFRFILHDWMALPFLLAILCRKNQKLVISLLTLVFISVLIFFNIHVYHDYYFIGESPFIFLVAGIGMVWLLNSKQKILLPLIAIMLVVFCYRTSKIKHVYSPLFWDYHSELVLALNLTKLTQPDDLIFVQEHYMDFAIPLYSERLVALGHQVRFIATEASMPSEEFLFPSTFHLTAGHEQLELLKPYSKIWIDALDKDFYLYRNREVGNYRLDPRKHFIVQNEPNISPIPGPKPEALPTNNFVIDLCKTTDDFRVFSIPSETHSLGIHPVEHGLTIALPARKYLSVPSHSPWGCRFEVK